MKRLLKHKKINMDIALVLNTIEKFVEEIAEEKCDSIWDAKHEHCKESETRYVDTHVNDEINVEDENETTISLVPKCEENLAMEVVEGMNEEIVNVEFYDELTFLEDMVLNPKYDGDEHM